MVAEAQLDVVALAQHDVVVVLVAAAVLVGCLELIAEAVVLAAAVLVAAVLVGCLELIAEAVFRGAAMAELLNATAAQILAASGRAKAAHQQAAMALPFAAALAAAPSSNLGLQFLAHPDARCRTIRSSWLLARSAW